MIRSLVYFVAIFFGVCLVIPIVYLAMSDLNDAIQGDEVFPQVAQDSMQTQTDAFNGVWDVTLLIVFFAVAAGMVALAWALPTNPVALFAMIVVIGILGVLTGFMANAYVDVTDGTDAYSTSAAGFPIMSFILEHYLEFTMAIGFLALIVFYAKPNQEGAFG